MTDTRTLGSNDAAWMASRRSVAVDRLADLAMPSEREEIWRYLDLDFDPAMHTAPETAGSAGSPDHVLETW
ncbi:MAG: hypothetical protein DRJ28_06020, partial [Actinobacteria bacterium]